LTKEQYIKDCWEAANDYMEAVLNGDIVTNENIRLAVKRHQNDLLRPDIEFRPEAVERVYKFAWYCFLSKGNRLILQPFQCFIILALFGLYYSGTNDRKYRYAFLFIGRKNGKTGLASFLQLYFMLADGVSFPHSVLIASSQKQAIETSFEALHQMIISSPALSKQLKVYRSNTIKFKNGTPGSCKTVPAIEDRLEGLNPSSCILDEIHTYKNAQYFNVIKNALGTKPNPMLFLISTAGHGKDSFCAELVESGRNELRGMGEHDDRFFYMLYELEEGDDKEDETKWIKSNPGLGTILEYGVMKDDLIKGKNIPSTMADFITKRLNLFLEENSQWIDGAVLDAAFGDFDEETVKDLPCYVGLDLSATRDLTSIVCLWDAGHKFYAKSYFLFVKSENNSLRKGNIEITRWVNEGHIFPCTTPTIDYEMVTAKIMDINNKYKVKGLYHDPWHFDRIKNEVQLAGIWCVPIASGVKNFDNAIRFLEELMFNELITIQTNPCMKWNFRNLVIARDMNGSCTPNKNDSADAIDGVISLLNCIAGHLKANKNAAQIFLNAL
jgi:phage terminase large subunit-like protein